MSSEATIAVAPGAVGPVREKDRIHNLDMLRGWAILGILAVNAISFAWPVELTMASAPPIQSRRGAFHDRISINRMPQ